MLALDGRPDAAGAIRVAEALSRRHGNDIHVTTVLEPLPLYLSGMEPYPDEVAPRRMARAQQDVSHRIQQVLGSEYRWPVAVVGGHVDDALTAVAEQGGAAAIIIGIGQHHAVDRILGGETSVRIAARSTLPVLAVPEWVTTLPHTAVVATDFGASSIAAAQTALDCLAVPGVLTLLHVAPVFDPLLTGRDPGTSYREALAEQFASIIDQLEVRPGIEVNTADVSGSPAAEILTFAERAEADLVAVGSHGVDRLDTRMIGSVASRLLRAARCSVIVAPAPSRASRAERAIEPITTDIWSKTLDDFGRRNWGRPTRLEIDDPALGAQIQERGYQLRGAAFDRHDGRVDIMLGTALSPGHFTRTIPGVVGVGVASGADGRHAALRVLSGQGRASTLLTFID